MVICHSSMHRSSGLHACAGTNHGWAIAVGIILGVLLVALIAVAAILLRRKRQREEASYIPLNTCASCQDPVNISGWSHGAPK